MNNYFSVAAIFKNEASILKEWLDHYLEEGADHFYLINNGSTDLFMDVLIPYQEKGLITLFNDGTRFKQGELYNKYFYPVKGNSEWLLICDLDEFVYARNGFERIPDYLRTLSEVTSSIHVVWKLFGSSNLKNQPEKVIPNFTKRQLYDGRMLQGMKNKKRGLCKTIVRTKYLKKIRIHSSKVQWPSKQITSQNSGINFIPRAFQKVDELTLKQSFLHLNHYAIQSEEYFRIIKSKRGSAANVNASISKSKMTYFFEMNKYANEKIDSELADKRNQKS